MPKSKPFDDAGGSSELDAPLITAAALRGTICADAKLSKRAAGLLRRECDGLATKLLKRSFSARAALGGPLEAQDVWEALLTDPSCAWLVDRLGLWNSSTPLPPSVPLPRPPAGLTPDSGLQPPLVWLRASTAFMGASWNADGVPDSAAPLHESLLEDDDNAPPSSKRPRPQPLHEGLLERA